jgi:dienelactone hydrolase
VTALCICSSISVQAQTALPDDISIASPSSNVARDAAAFSGAWLGYWGEELPSALVVEQIDSNGVAQVIYSWGDLKEDGLKTGWERQTGQILNGTLQLAQGNPPEIDFTFEPDGTLMGWYHTKNGPPAFARFQHLSITNGLAVRDAAKGMPVPWDEIRIPVHSEIGPTRGKTFALQTTIFPQASPGKHPVVIFNHGSTGPGIIPVTETYRGAAPIEFFHSLGYIVVEPMRKGRGASEGPNVEEDESVAPDVQLDSAIEDVHAVVEYLRTQTNVDSNRIVVSGVSRGGLLSVAYAGRYPEGVIGVINFSGGWFGEGMPTADFNFKAFAEAGHNAKVPMLWLYGDHDSFYSLKFDEAEFKKFQEAGGRGEMVEVHDIPGEGHLLFLWMNRWQDKATGYLKMSLKR